MEKPVVLADVPAEFEGHPHWQLFQRIVASPQFARSARLRTFLQYVTQCALLNHADQVTEQQIGVFVFGKPANYNASEDNIVRSQARFLRAKLAEYFESEPGHREPVVLAIPKGTYVPHFSARVEPPATPPEVVPPLEVLPQGGARRRFRVIAVAVFVCLLLAGALLWRKSPAPVRLPEDGLWSRLFEARRQTTIVASDYIFSMVQEAAGRSLSLDEYLGAGYFNRVAELNRDSGLERLFPNIAQRHYTGFENVTSVARLMSLKQAQTTQTVIRFARDLTMRDMGAGNLVLLGSKQSNPWVALFEARLNFRFEYQAAGHNIFVLNREPRPGEQAEYWPSSLDEQSRVIYGGIAFLPNLNPGTNVLIMQGTSMGGAEVALEVLHNPALFRDLVRRIAPNGRPGDLPYFEALIRTRTVNGVAGESAIVACRVFQ